MQYFKDFIVGDLAEAFSGYAFSAKDLVDKGIPVLKIGNIQRKNVTKTVDTYYNGEIVGKLEKYILQQNDFLIAMTGAGSVGRVGKMHDNNTTYLVNQRVAIVRPTKADANFLYYWFSMPFVEKYLYSLGIGAGQPNISAKDILKLKIKIPNRNIQTKIADILSTYDNLIEINNKRIKLLEKIAENLYKEWFIRFRFPEYENAEFENGIPKGWTIKRMQEFCYVTDGTHNSPKSVDIGIPLITGKCISNGFIDFNISYNISSSEHESIKKRSGLKSGDIIFSNIGTVGNCCIIDYDREFSVKNVIIFKPKTMVETSYLYYWLTSSIMQEIFSTQTNGASQQFVGLNFMRRYKLFVPSNDVLENFAKKIVPIINQKKLLHKINLKLIEQRDLLLPRLMSGKFEVE